MRQFMEKAEPEGIQAIVTKSQCDNRRVISREQCGTIEVSFWKVPLDNEVNAKVVYPLGCTKRPIGPRAQLSNFAKDFFADVGGREL